MKYLFQILCLLTSFTATAQRQLVVDADAEIRTVAGSFKSIKVSNAIHLYLSKGDQEEIAISASEQKYKDGIVITIENEELQISYAGPNKWSSNFHKLNVYVAYKNVEQITATSASNVLLAGIMELPLLNIRLSGASVLKGQIKIAELNVKCSGASNLNLSGEVKNMNMECSGASDVSAYALVADNCIVKASGASDVSLTASKEIIANASGASNIYYKGSAVLKEKNSSGASTIAKRD
jgi:hypothetical protein